jgi:hypothetical protein
MTTVDSVVERGGVRALMLTADGPSLDGEAAAVDLVGAAFSGQASVIVVPVPRLHPDFFTLRTGIAGAVLQKFVNYRLRLVVVGDLTGRLERSETLRAFVAEADRGRDLWFVPDLTTLDSRLTH